MSLPFIYPCKPIYLPPTAPILARFENDLGWVAEIKRNGWRAEVARNSSGTQVFTSSGNDISDKLPDLAKYLKSVLPANTIIDGELMNHRSRDLDQVFYAFDLLMLRGKILTDRPLSERREKLFSLLKPSAFVILPDSVFRDKLTFYKQAIKAGHEGIVIKKLAGEYPLSLTRTKKHPGWIKVKPYQLFDGKYQVVS